MKDVKETRQSLLTVNLDSNQTMEKAYKVSNQKNVRRFNIYNLINYSLGFSNSLPFRRFEYLNYLNLTSKLKEHSEYRYYDAS